MSTAMLPQDTTPAAEHAMQVDCHSAVSTDSADAQLKSASSCCQMYCQCSALSGFVMPVNMISPPFVSRTLSLKVPYLTAIPQAPQSSLYRPPISV